MRRRCAHPRGAGSRGGGRGEERRSWRGRGLFPVPPGRRASFSARLWAGGRRGSRRWQRRWRAAGGGGLAPAPGVRKQDGGGAPKAGPHLFSGLLRPATRLLLLLDLLLLQQPQRPQKRRPALPELRRGIDWAAAGSGDQGRAGAGAGTATTAAAAAAPGGDGVADAADPPAGGVGRAQRGLVLRPAPGHLRERAAPLPVALSARPALHPLHGECGGGEEGGSIPFWRAGFPESGGRSRLPGSWLGVRPLPLPGARPPPSRAPVP